MRAEEVTAFDLKRITELRLGHIRQRRGPFEPRPIVLWLGEHVRDLTPEQTLLYAASMLQMSHDGRWVEPKVELPDR